MRIAVVEDEAVVARRLVRMVRDFVGPADITISPTLRAAFDAIRGKSLDLVFLDLNLNGGDGFTLLEEAVASPFQTIVVSAHHDQALRAFDYGVADFVAKPWTEERLRTAIQRATGQDPRHRANRLVVRKGRELRTIATSDIVFVRGADDYSELHLTDGSMHLHEKSLTALETLLPADFSRAHRSYIVNLTRVRGARSATLVMDEGSLVPIGRVHRESVRARLSLTHTQS